ncbi:MAG: COG1361 S-layer family protein, partial [Haloarculaceae archaeon]
MVSRTALALVVSALLVVPAVSVAAVTGSPDLSAQFQDRTVVPGEDVTLDLIIVNQGTVDSGSNSNTALNSRVTTARGLTVKLNNGDAPVTVRSNKQAVGNLGEGTSSPISFDIAVADDAETGSYNMKVRVDYVYTSYISESDGSRQEETVSKTLTVPLKVEDTAQFDVTDVDSSARVDSTGTVALTVENTGSETANSTSLTLESTNSDLTFGSKSSATRHVGRWEPGETRTVRYRVTTDADAVSDTYPFELSADFEGKGGVEKSSRTISLGIPTAPEQNFTVVETDSDVAVGDSGAYTVTLRNDGPVDVRDATVKLSSSNGDITFGSGSSTTQYVG